MKRIPALLFLLAALLLAGVVASCSPDKKKAHYPFQPVAFTQVHVNDAFWSPRLEAARQVTIPLAFSKCEETGRYDNFAKAADQMHSSENKGYRVGGYSFDDTDVYKTIEGASYLLQTHPDPRLVAYIDSVLDIVAAAQEPDGYLYTARTMNPRRPHSWAGTKRWEKVEDLSHEFYNLGHMVEGAVAHYQATGSRKFLDIAIRYADCVCREIGLQEGQTARVPGHQIAEMALAKLYTVTGDAKYLQQARFFLDQRGRTEARSAYNQSHRPILEQDEAVGHAVRAMYMYSGIADVAGLTGDTAYIAAIDRLWDNIVSKKLYLTGGVGATSRGEAFGRNYELPNASAYCETCAAIGNVYLNERLFLLHGQSKYIDVLERTLYNGLISGVSLDGGRFFYPNPLASHGGYQRQAWFGCACCPSNICRFLPSLPGYVYARRDNDLYVNLFMGGEAEIDLKSTKVGIQQQTTYPWGAFTDITVNPQKEVRFKLKIRIPGWIKNQPVPSDLYHYSDGLTPSWSVCLNGEILADSPQGDADGYYSIDRRWKKGDVVSLYFDMPVRKVQANDQVIADQGLTAVECGPLVYCAEQCDNALDVLNCQLSPTSVFKQRDLCFHQSATDQALWESDTDEVDLQGKGYRLLEIDTQAFVPDHPEQTTTLRLIPYFAWAHRQTGPMTVWLK